MQRSGGVRSRGVESVGDIWRLVVLYVYVYVCACVFIYVYMTVYDSVCVRV